MDGIDYTQVRYKPKQNKKDRQNERKLLYELVAEIDKLKKKVAKLEKAGKAKKQED